jgi:hypothetical protein
MVENSPSSTEASDDLATPTATSRLWSFAFPSPFTYEDEANENDAMADVDAVDAAAPSTLTMEQVMSLLTQLAAKKSPSFAPLASPRHGNVSDTGVWTGMGASGGGQRAFSKYCMRAFKTDPIKNHQHMHPIEDKCKTGLRDSPELLFSLRHEPNAKTVVNSIRAFEKFAANCGLDGVFTIIDRNLASVNFLQQPGMVNVADIDTWCSDLLETGVWGTDKDSGDTVRLPVCQYDLVNMDWSAEAVLNSCTPALRYDLENKVALQHHTGPKLMMTLLTMLYRPSLSKLKELRGQLEALDIRTYPAENVTLFCHDASKLICKIRMNFMKNQSVDDLTTIALTGLHHCSEELLRIKVRTISMDNDVNGFESGVGNQKADALDVLQEAENMYQVLVNMNAYAPAKQVEKKAGLSALQAAIALQASLDKGKLGQDRNAGGTGGTGRRATGVCWDCESKDHFRGDPSCPKQAAGAGTPPGGVARPSRHGLDDATSAAVAAQSAIMLKDMPLREHIPDTAEYNIVVGGKIVAKYCRHCDRFVKGSSQHYTKDHTGTRNVFAYKGPPPTAPVPLLAPPAMVAALANLSPVPPVDLTALPKVSTAFLFRHQAPTNYDFGSMGSMGSSVPHANVAQVSFESRLNDILDSDDPDTLLAALGNEYGG